MIRVKSEKAQQMEFDQLFLDYVTNSAEDLKEQKNLIQSLFPSYIQKIIENRFQGKHEDGNELQGIMAALMFVGTDIEDNDHEFLQEVIKKKYHVENNPLFDTQRFLSRFLFGTTVDFVSNLL